MSIIGASIPIVAATACIVDAFKTVKSATTTEEALAAAAAAVALAQERSNYLKSGENSVKSFLDVVLESTEGCESFYRSLLITYT